MTPHSTHKSKVALVSIYAIFKKVISFKLTQGSKNQRVFPYEIFYG